MTNNVLLAYLQEFFKRLSMKSPKFFRIISTVSGIAAAITGLPALLEEFGVNLPDWASVIESKIVAIATMTAFFISKLTVQSTPTGVTENGEVLKKTNSEKLPFTASNEQKSAEDKNLETLK